MYDQLALVKTYFPFKLSLNSIAKAPSNPLLNIPFKPNMTVESLIGKSFYFITFMIMTGLSGFVLCQYKHNYACGDQCPHYSTTPKICGKFDVYSDINDF